MQSKDFQHAGIAVIAEDDPIIRMDFARLISGLGFKVFEVASADMALAYLETNAVDFLFTDVEMPGSMDGVALAEEVKRRWPNVAVVICSGLDPVEEGALPDAARFLAKPFNTDAIGRIMQEMRIV